MEHQEIQSQRSEPFLCPNDCLLCYSLPPASINPYPFWTVGQLGRQYRPGSGWGKKKEWHSMCVMCIYVHMYIPMCVWVCLYMCICVCLYMCICAYRHTNVCTCVCRSKDSISCHSSCAIYLDILTQGFDCPGICLFDWNYFGQQAPEILSLSSQCILPSLAFWKHGLGIEVRSNSLPSEVTPQPSKRVNILRENLGGHVQFRASVLMSFWSLFRSTRPYYSITSLIFLTIKVHLPTEDLRNRGNFKEKLKKRVISVCGDQGSNLNAWLLRCLFFEKKMHMGLWWYEC